MTFRAAVGLSWVPAQALSGPRGCGQAAWLGVGRPPMGFQNSATGPGLGFYAARSYSWMRPPRAGRCWMRSETGRRRGDLAGAGRAGGCDGAAVRC